MGSTQQILIKHLETLKDSTNSNQEKCGALTYITSNVGLCALSESSDSHLFEFGKIIIEMISSENEDLSSVANKSFQILIKKSLKLRELKWFQLSLQMNRKKRLKFYECLETVETHNLTSISRNEESLEFINDCMQTVQATSMSWLSPNSCIDNIQSLKQAENKKKSDQFEVEENLITKAIEFLQRLYEFAVNHPEYKPQQFHVLLLDKVATLAYMGLKNQRGPALKLLNLALTTDFVCYVQDKLPNLWNRYKDNLQTIYCARMSLLVKSNEQDWSIQWTISIQMLGTELHRGAQLINYLLGIEEKAFKSSDTNIRRQAFLCWQLLIDNFALNPVELSSARRVKLLCIPLNAKNSKTELLALTKLEVWWHLIIKLNPLVPMYANQVLSGFLDFCFGPLGDTPLLSRTVDVIASPGKRFNKTRIFAVDALLQMLIRRKEDRQLISSALKEELPSPISSGVFKEAYKILFHSVGEAVLIISSMSDYEFKNRDKLCKILWSNLVEYVEESPEENRIEMFRELILVVGEIASHVDDSPMIRDLILNVITSELADQSEDLLFDDDTLIELTKKLLTPVVLKKIEDKQFEGIKMIAYQALKPKALASYHSGTLSFIKSILRSVETNFKRDVFPECLHLWCLFAEILFKYISEKQNINEGTDSVYNFTTVQMMINFPFSHVFWRGPEQVSKVGNLWGKLYIIFVKNADALPTINSNELLNSVTTTVEEFCKKEKQCYQLVAHIVGALVSSINYQTLIPSKKIPPLVSLMRDVTLDAFLNKQNLEIELSLKALSSFLITIFGLLEPFKTLLCLEVVKPSIEKMLEADEPETIEKEVFHTWETVVLILKGHAKNLSNDLLSSYRTSIRLASLHKSKEISAQTQVLWKLNDLQPELKSFLSELEKEVQNTLSKTFTKKKIERPTKTAGSFLGRVQLGLKTFTTPRILSNNRKEKEGKKIAPFSPEPDSQDYVVITNDVHVDASRLTEHQKESLKRRRDDIPAMYNDLSQSASRDTQDLQEWFNSKSSKTVILDKSNENKKQLCTNDKTVELSKPSEEMEVSATCDESKIISDTHKEMDLNKKIFSTVETSSPGDGYDGTERQAGASTITDEIVKKLDFESREEFPDENENTEGNETNSKTAANYGLRKRGSILNKEKNEEDLHSRLKRGRPPTPKVQVVRLAKAIDQADDKNVKRKAMPDVEFDTVEKKRRRRTTTEQNQSYETPSDSESIYSTESENQTSIIQDLSNDEKLPEQTKRELSRLRIDMVSDSYLPGRRRSKFSEEVSEFFTAKKNSSESRNNRFRTAKPEKEEESQELVKKRTRRVPSKFNLDSSKQEETSPSANRRQSVDPKVNSGIEDSSNALNSLEKKDSPENSPKKESPTASITKSDEMSDQDEVVESSQDPNALLLRSPKRSMEKKFGKINSPNRSGEGQKIVPETEKNTAELDDTFFDSTKNDSKLEVIQSAKKSPEKWKQSPISALSKNGSKLKPFRPTRTQTIMSCLLSNKKKEDDEPIAIAEMKDSQSEKLFKDNETLLKKNKIKEFDSGSPKTRRDRPSILSKQPDRIGSPSGSRQEKIFNIMKIGELTPPTSLFSKLKNDGEKISPKMKKTQDAMSNDESNKNCDETYPKENDNIVTLGRERLPILEWSNANPPSLSASPSVSILKPKISILDNSENETTPSKRKRVSFADPPVSRQMGYRVLSSPSESKLGIPRSVIGRKDTPIKIKQSRFREIKINVEKSQQSSVENSSEGNRIENLTDVDIQGQEEFFAQIATELEDAADMNIDSDTDETPEEIPPAEPNNSDSSIPQIDSVSQTVELDINPGQSVDTQQDLFNTIQTDEKSKSTLADFFDPKFLEVSKKSFPINVSDTPEVEVTSLKSKNVTEAHQDNIVVSSSPMSSDSLKLTIMDDFLIGQEVLSEPIVLRKDLQPLSNNLEDTVLIQNISRLNSSAASDEMFNERLVRTSTQTTTMIATAECDTLPITDSMTLSQSMTQESLGTQATIGLSQNLPINQTEPVYRTLLGCEEPISSIIKDLTNPLWVSNLSNYFFSRSIETVGDLAKSSEQEVSRMPVKGTNRVLWVKTVLDRFAKAYIPKLEAKYNDPISPKISKNLLTRTSTPRQSDNLMEIIEETIEFNTRDDAQIPNTTDELTTSNKSIELSDNMIEPKRTQNTQPSNAYGSIIIDTSISPSKNSSTGIDESQIFSKSKTIENTVDFSMIIKAQSIQVQSALLKDLMHNLDENIVLQNVVERCSIEQILRHLNGKLNHFSKEKKLEEIMKMLEINRDVDSNLKAACVEIGLSKVLLRLPEIFNSDKNLVAKVLEAYRTNITSMDSIHPLDIKVLKQIICKFCTSLDLWEMLSTVLNEEEKKEIVTPLTETVSLKAMLKRIPVESILRHTIADDELIPSLSVLEVGLKKNETSVVTKKIVTEFPDITNEIFRDMSKADDFSSRITGDDIGKEKMLDIYQAISAKFSIDELTAAFGEAIKRRLDEK